VRHRSIQANGKILRDTWVCDVCGREFLPCGPIEAEAPTELRALFHVQDADRPLYVLARDYSSALHRWIERIASENHLTPADTEPPDGIALVARAEEVLE
jgi:hypothetical protein